ncbi:MAG TPA: hydrogenase HupD, partial [Sporomusaceae bacterium]|nr:hydrogenase HupD [Sporomusaceae bacterium]
MQNAKITVLGIGNILLQDEGFGVRVIERLGQRFTFSSDVQLLDGGTLGMELMRFLAGTEKLILVDAISGNQVPGTQYDFRNDQVKAYFKDKVSMHE